MGAEIPRRSLGTSSAPRSFNEAAPRWVRKFRGRRASRFGLPGFNEAAPRWARKRYLAGLWTTRGVACFNEAAPRWARKRVVPRASLSGYETLQ